MLGYSRVGICLDSVAKKGEEAVMWLSGAPEAKRYRPVRDRIPLEVGWRGRGEGGGSDAVGGICR